MCKNIHNGIYAIQKEHQKFQKRHEIFNHTYTTEKSNHNYESVIQVLSNFLCFQPRTSQDLSGVEHVWKVQIEDNNSASSLSSFDIPRNHF